MNSPIKQCNGLEAFLDGRLEGEDRHCFETHLAECDNCQEAVKAWQTVKSEYACWVEGVTSDGEDSGRPMEARGFAASILQSAEGDGAASRAQKRKEWKPYRVAAAAAVLLGLSFAIYFAVDGGQPESNLPAAATAPSQPLAIPAMVIANGVKKDVVFEGGSETIIAAPGNGRVLASVGRDRFGLGRFGEMRITEAAPEQTTIRLIQGEAAFGVSPRSEGFRFTVKADEVTIEVVGTRFSVAVDDAHTVIVCVEEGNVSVLAKNWRIQLNAGSSITVEGGVALPVKTASRQEAETLTTLLSENVPLAGDTEDEAVKPVTAADIPSVRKPNALARREKEAALQKHLDAWRDLIIDGEVQEAEAQLRAFLRQSPKDVESLMLLANCQKRQGRYRDAVETYQRIIASGDDRFANRARYLAAELSYAKLNDLHGAVSLLDDYLKHAPADTPNRADARLMQAEALLGMGANARARRVLEEIVNDYGRIPIANRARELLGLLPDKEKHHK